MWIWLLAACTGPDLGDSDSASVGPTGVTDSVVDSTTDTGPTDTGATSVLSTWTFGDDAVTVLLDDPDSTARTYTLTSTHPQRDGGPSTRTFSESEDQVVLRSGNDLLDALFALAVHEAGLASIDAVTDGSFNSGAPVDCRCFETGEQWTWVWTRDTAYATHLGLAWLDPERSWASLDFKLSEHKDALGGGGLQIVQDTGSGGSWPVSTDRVSWALGADRTLDFLTPERRAEVLPRAYEALANTLVLNTRYAWDPTDGLYRGEQSFLDWREQSYPTRTAADVVPIAASKALSTNGLHLEALRIAADWAAELGHDPTDWTAQAEALDDALRAFWSADSGTWHSVLGGPFDPSLTAQVDALGVALRVRSATAERAARAVAAHPHGLGGPAVIAPQQPFTPIYHNRSAWPFVTAYVGLAARQTDNPDVFAAGFDALIRSAALNLSHLENLELTTGANHLDDGEYAGPVVNSRRQLWSVAGFLGMVVDGLFGLEASPDGPTLSPWIPARVRQDWLGDQVRIKRFPWQGLDLLLDLPILPDADRPATGAITWVVDEGDPDTLFAPVEPTLSDPAPESDRLVLTLGDGGDPDIALDVYRDGVRVAQDLAPGTWTDPDSDPDTEGPCYAVRSRHVSTGLGSQHPAAACWWGDGYSRIQQHDATSFTTVGGTLVDHHGRWHHQDWGEPGHSLMLSFTATATGPHWLQAVYSNGAGGIDTGVTSATKWLTLTDSTGATVAEGPLVMPHTAAWDRWADSTLVPASLSAGESYTLTLTEGFNMSWLDHHTLYSRAGGGKDAYGYVNIAALKVLGRGSP